MSVVTYELNEDIAVITLDNPPVNALSWALREGVLTAVQRAQTDAANAIVIICEGNTFIAGADIKEFGQPPQSPVLAEVLAAIEASTKPVIAAIHGTALGGGLELALACHYRCALQSAKVGLPEVNLGLIPGGGGSQRLPRLIGVAAALETILSGKPLAAEKAAELGIVDRLVDNDLRDKALRYSRHLVDSGVGQDGKPPRRTGELLIDRDQLPERFFAEARQRVSQRYRGYLAQTCIVEALEAAATMPFSEGLACERELFQQCVASPQSRALRYQFFAERQAGKISGISTSTSSREIKSIGVVGAGTMGGGIAMCFADAGIPVILLEAEREALQRGLDNIRRNYERSAQKGRMSQAQIDERLGLIRGALDYGDLADVDLVVEAVFESLEVKQTVFETLDRVCKPDAILASNTSYLDVNEISAFTRRPENVIGMHFFSPANVMRLLELVRTDSASVEVLATALEVSKRIGKIAVPVGVCYGFVGNRLFTTYGREAQMLLLEGATPAQVDAAIVEWGMAMGPLSVVDLAGLDIGYKARQAWDKLPDDPRYFHIGNVLVEMGRLGQKTGKGFYCYDPDTRDQRADPEVEALIRTEAERLGVRHREIGDEEIVERLIYPIINEAARVLEEGIAQRSSDIDVILVNGYGFPRYRGGPLHYADSVGLKNVYRRICEFRDQLGDRFWEPAPLLKRLALEGKGFKDL